MGNRGSGSTSSPEPRYLVVGEVLRPHGVRGEIRVKTITAYPERLELHTQFYLSHPNSPAQVERRAVERLRLQQSAFLLKLAGCDDRNAADELRGMWVQIPIEEAAPLEEGEYYTFQLIGARVETEDGEPLGELIEVIETGANDVYVVHGPHGELLLPAIDDVVLAFEWETPPEKRLIVRLLPGMLDAEGEE